MIDEHLNSYNSPYKFNAKELDPETQRVRRTPLKNKHKVRQTGNYYYGARYAVYPAKSGKPKTSIWLSVDPLAEKYPNFSPYAYTFNNPLNFVDPTGMEGEGWDDDYFNKKGKYLGSDNAETDNVRIIDQESWDKNKKVNENGVETIGHTIGNNNSVKFSESKLQTEEELNVFQHYNPTDLHLEAD